MGYVYLIGELDNPSRFKIGVTNKKDVESRLSELQTGNSESLYLCNSHPTEYPFIIEKMLHRHFNSHRLINEWFELDENEVKGFKDTCDKYEMICQSLKDNPFFNKKKKG